MVEVKEMLTTPEGVHVLLEDHLKKLPAEVLAAGMAHIFVMYLGNGARVYTDKFFKERIGEVLKDMGVEFQAFSPVTLPKGGKTDEGN